MSQSKVKVKTFVNLIPKHERIFTMIKSQFQVWKLLLLLILKTFAASKNFYLKTFIIEKI